MSLAQEGAKNTCHWKSKKNHKQNKDTVYFSMLISLKGITFTFIGVDFNRSANIQSRRKAEQRLLYVYLAAKQLSVLQTSLEATRTF